MGADSIEAAPAGALRGIGPDPRRWKALALLCLASFMVILDAQIVILALPSIEVDLGFSSSGSQWVLSAYLLTFGGLLLLGGRSADLLGRRRMFVVGTSLFLISSLACGMASSAGFLVASRAVQGVSAAIMAPTALSILLTTFDDAAERNKALGIWSGIGGVGATAALLIGGVVTDVLGWEWIFFLNIPVAVILLALSPLLLRESRNADCARCLDLAGAATITGAAVLLVFALVEAPDAGWASLQTIGLLAGAAVLIPVFILVETRSRGPLVPLYLFRSPALVGGNLGMVMLGTVAFAISFLVSLYAQQILGYSAIEFGLASVVLTVMAVVGSYGGQALVPRLSVRFLAVTGLLLGVAGSLLLAQVSAGGSYFGDIFFGLLVFGPGLGCCYVATSIAALSDVAEREAGVASGINTAAFQIGGALGVAVTTSVASAANGAASGLSEITRGLQAGFVACVVMAALGALLTFVILGKPRRVKADTALSDL
jgi:EmrB/QacA subfamily drug resistance transporter